MTKMQQDESGRTIIKSNGEEKFEYYENGNKKIQEHYQDGKRISRLSWNEDGELDQIWTNFDEVVKEVA